MHKNKKHLKLNKSDRAKHSPEKVISKIILKMFKQASFPVIIAIGGPGGTGKSTFSKKLAKLLKDSSILRLDDYKTSRLIRKDKNLFGPHPEANKMELIKKHLSLIGENKNFKKPVYDAVTGDAFSLEPYHVKKFNVLDGEISTYLDFKEYIHLSIFIDSDWKTQLKTRITRDIDVRGYSKDKAIDTFLQSNLREFYKYGLNSKNWADIHLYSRDDYHLVLESVTKIIYQQYLSVINKEYASIEIEGLVVPVLTPFDIKGGVDEKTFISHLEFLSLKGVKKILINDTIAEFFSLTQAERRRLFKIARNYFPGIIILNISYNCMKTCRDEAIWGEGYGADGLLCLPPSFMLGLKESNIVSYFNFIKEGIDIPFIIYNHLLSVNNQINSNILDGTNAYGLKDDFVDKVLLKKANNYFVGDDNKIVTFAKKGAKGFFSTLANIYPDLFVEIEDQLNNSNYKQALTILSEINKINKSIRSTNQIVFYKEQLSMINPNFPCYVRRPL